MIKKRQMRNVSVVSALVLFVLPLCLPAALAWGATYYVSTDGDDTNAGTSPKLAWKTISHAARKAQAGDLVRIKAGNYGARRVVIANSGTPEAPIRFEGYDGDVVLDGMTKELKEKMEQRWKKDGASLKKRGVSLSLEGSGVDVRGAHIKISGLTVLKYGGAIIINGHHVTADRCTARLCSWAGIVAMPGSHHCEVKHCTAHNCGMSNIWLAGRDNTAADCWSYTNRNLIGIITGGVDTSTDYCYVSANSRNIHFIRCRGDGRCCAGHGLEFTAGGSTTKGCQNCRVTDCEMYNCWTLFGARHCSHDITFVNCYGERNSKASTHGFFFRTGAHNILVKNCRVRGVENGLDADDAGGRWRKSIKGEIARNITFENCIATHCTNGIYLNAPNSKAIKCLTARNKCGVMMGSEKGISIKDCIICRNETGIRGGPTATISHCNIWDNQTDFAGKVKPGENCISKDPQFGGKADRHWWLKDTSPCKDMGPYADDSKASIGMR